MVFPSGARAHTQELVRETIMTDANTTHWHTRTRTEREREENPTARDPLQPDMFFGRHFRVAPLFAAQKKQNQI